MLMYDTDDVLEEKECDNMMRYRKMFLDIEAKNEGIKKHEFVGTQTRVVW